MCNPTPKEFGHTFSEVSIMCKANIAVSVSVLILLLCSSITPTVSSTDISPQRSYGDDLVLLATGETQQLTYNCDSYSEVSAAEQSIGNVYASCRWYPTPWCTGICKRWIHLWSAVMLDGTEYYTDATWYDSSGGTKYFALTHSEIEAGHTFTEGF